ncbi:MAG: FAD:protein FMN transferase [Treponema sp.]|nr:FAD:protein FMN transferase [Treponema sp.]
MKLQAYGQNAHEANSQAQEYINKLEDLISTTKNDSEIYKLNQSKEFPIEVSKECSVLLKYALNMSEISDGAFNPALYPITKMWGFTQDNYKIPSAGEIKEKITNCHTAEWASIKIEDNKITLLPGMQLDLGGIGKGYAGDQIIEIYKAYGIKSALIDLGGNIQLLGKKNNGSEWTIGIKNPFGQGTIGQIKASDQAIISSGGYERYFISEDGKKYIHIIDGQNGYPVDNEIEAVTVVGKSGAYCDALSTALFVMGLDKAIDLWKKQKDFDFIIVTKDKTVNITSSLSKRFTLNGDLAFQVKTIK